MFFTKKVDEIELLEYISKETQINKEVIVQVLKAELKFLKEKGIAK